MSSKTILAVSGLVIVAGCAALQSEGIEPIDAVKRVTHGTSFSHAGLLYEIGRDHFANGRHALATESFEKALAADPNFLEARNALGIAWATRGNYEEAIAHLERAVKAAPERADFHNNLGYALHLQGRVADAIPRFRQATTLEPDNTRFQGNLQTATNQAAGVQVASNNAGPIRVGEAARNIAAPASNTPLRWSPEGEKAAAAAEATKGAVVTTAQARPELRAVASPAPQVPVKVARAPTGAEAVQAQPAKRTAPEPKSSTASAAPAPQTVGFEVSNGNGVKGMARRVAALLRAHGIHVTRVTNNVRFTQPATQVQFRRGYENEALKMQDALTARAPMVETQALRRDVNVRLVIGRDSGKDATKVVQRPTRAIQSAQAPLVEIEESVTQ